jgi:hypothetical protein
LVLINWLGQWPQTMPSTLAASIAAYDPVVVSRVPELWRHMAYAALSQPAVTASILSWEELAGDRPFQVFEISSNPAQRSAVLTVTSLVGGP